MTQVVLKGEGALRIVLDEEDLTALAEVLAPLILAELRPVRDSETDNSEPPTRPPRR